MKRLIAGVAILLLGFASQSVAEVRAVLGFSQDPEVRVGQLVVLASTLVYVILESDVDQNLGGVKFSFVPGTAHLGDDLIVLASTFAGTDADSSKYAWDIRLDQCVGLSANVPLVVATIDILRLTSTYETNNEQFCVRAGLTISDTSPLEGSDCAGNSVPVVLAPATTVAGAAISAGPGCSMINPCCEGLPLESVPWSSIKSRY